MFTGAAIRHHLGCANATFKSLLLTLGLYSPLRDRLYTEAEAKRILVAYYKRGGRRKPARVSNPEDGGGLATQGGPGTGRRHRR